MKKLVLLCCVAIALMACGDDVTKVYETNYYNVTQIVQSGDSIGACSVDNEGASLYVEDSSSLYFCVNQQWISMNEMVGTGNVDTVVRIDTLYLKDTVIIRESTVHDTIFEKGLDGASCTAVEISLGYKIVCGGDSVGVVMNGKDGEKGLTGDEGRPGPSAYDIYLATVPDEETPLTKEEWIEKIMNGSGNGSSSSSSSAVSSSAASSSSKIVWSYLNKNKTYGSFIDQRDGQEYKTIVIGSQTWMAENLNYKVLGSYCYDGDDEACATYGRLYPYGMAKKACPEGWHLPSKDEYATMYSAASKNYSNILSAHNGGNNSSGFSLIYAGYKLYYGTSYNSIESAAYLWTSTMGSEKPYAIGPFVVGNNFYTYGAYDSYSYSVRCLKN